ncbi:hypothetical protein [Leadbetterella byssophila]|uniref:hypothetical protein n=1 Tax=Leadbetterella byssophila TaxID=316068 RepID=UPI0039A1CCC0
MKTLRWGYYLLLIFLIGYYYWVHLKYAIAFPIKDEYRTICKVVIDYLQVPGFWAKFKVFLVNENESLQLVLKLLNIGIFTLTGSIPYTLLSFIGQLSLLAFPFIMLDKRNPFALGLIVLVIFNLQYYVLSFRHDTSFYYHVGLAGVLLASYYYVRKEYIKVFWFFLLGIFNNTAAVLILPVFLIDFLLTQKGPSLKVILGGLVLLVLVLGGFYLLNPHLFYLPENGIVTFKSFLIILGNYVDFHFGYLREKPYLFFGSLSLVFTFSSFIFYLFGQKKTDSQRLYFILGLFFFISLVAIALKRSSLYQYLFTLLDPRYKIFTFPLIVFCILLWCEMIKVPRLLKGLVWVLFLCHNILSAFREQDAIRYYDQAIRLNSVSVPRGYDMMGPVHIDFATKIYDEMRQWHVQPKMYAEAVTWYKYMEDYVFTGLEKRFEAVLDQSRIFDTGRYHTVLNIEGKSIDREALLVLKSEQNTFLFAIDFYYPKGYLDWIKTGEYCSSDFNTRLFLSVLEEGEYTLALFAPNKEVLVHPDKVIIDSKVRNMVDENV